VKTSLSAAGHQDPSRPPFQLVDVTAAPLFEENHRLRAALDEAVRESAAKSRFLAAMSHELRTPLSSILGFSQLLDTGGPLTEKQRRFVRHIEVSGRHLLALINEVLDLSKVAAGELEVAISEVDVAEVVEITAEALRPLAEARSQVLEVAVPGRMAVQADSRRLRQALTNLLANAIKFTPDGGWIGVRAQRATSCVEVSVTDNGIGIAEADQARVFEEFTQLEAGRRAGGTGLGLAVTRQLVEAMGGRVLLTSGLGLGSTFTVRLPAVPSPPLGCF
jgi:signal transduction histidine kinase